MNLGWHLASLGDGPAAIARSGRALDLHREVGSLIGEPMPETIWATGMRRSVSAPGPW